LTAGVGFAGGTRDLGPAAALCTGRGPGHFVPDGGRDYSESDSDTGGPGWRKTLAVAALCRPIDAGGRL